MAMRRMPHGACSKEAQAIFERYMENNVRQLNKTEAIQMLSTEFGLNASEAENMFDTFDKDQNGIMSIWEFQQFYTSMGNSAADVVKRFRELDADGSGKLDKEEAREGLKAMKTGTGRLLEDKEIDFFLLTTADKDGIIDLGTFSNLLARMKLYKSPPPPKNAKLVIEKKS